MHYELATADSVSDLGVRFDSKLSFMDHINDKVNKAYSILGIIKRNFIHLDINSLFYCIRLWLDHIWNMQILSGAYIRKATEIIEKV